MIVAKLVAPTIVLIALMIVGCGPKRIPSKIGEPAPVSGSVTLPNGQPLPRGSVAFFPVEEGKGQESFAMLDGSGSFTTTVAPGAYKVAIEPEWVRTAGNPGQSPIPAQYRSAATTTLEFEIPTGGKDGLAIALK